MIICSGKATNSSDIYQPMKYPTKQSMYTVVQPYWWKDHGTCCDMDTPPKHCKTVKETRHQVSVPDDCIYGKLLKKATLLRGRQQCWPRTRREKPGLEMGWGESFGCQQCSNALVLIPQGHKSTKSH